MPILAALIALRKPASIILLATIMLAFFAPGIYYPFAKCVHQITVHRWLKTQNHTLFTRMVFTQQQASAIFGSDENEFDLNGKRYDILKKQAEGNLWVVYCVNDSEEEALFEKASGAAQSNAQQLSVIKSVLLVLYQYIETQQLPAINPNMQIEHAAEQPQFYCNYQGDIVSPPPQV